MAETETLRRFISQRLTAAAEEIFGMFERTLAEYQKEPNGHRNQEEADVNPGLLLPKTEEHDELWTGQQEDQLQGLEYADIKSTFGPVPVKTKEEDEETPQPSWPQHSNVGHLKTEAVGNFCRGCELDGNSNSDKRLTQDTNDETPRCPELETDDSDNWHEGSGLQSGSDILQNKSRCNIGEKSFSCSECGKQYSLKRSLKRHRRIHKETLFRCFLCGTVFAQKESLRQHMNIHVGEKLFACFVCNETFTQKSLLVCHVEEMQHSQSVCGKELTCDYQQNKQQSLGYQPTDDQAGQTDGNSEAKDMKLDGEDHGGSEEARVQDLYKHIQPDVNDETSGIPEPETEDSDDWQEGSQLQSSSNFLRNKSQPNTGQKSFSCSECSKQFSFKGNLKRHMKVHTKEKSKIEKRPSVKECHDTGKKPFSCSYCRKRYKQKGQLLRHMQFHTSEKPYSCDVCQVRFTWLCQLRKHRCRGPKLAQFHGSQVEASREPQPLVTDGYGEPGGASVPERNLKPATLESASHSFDSETDDSQDWEDTRKS